MKKIIFTLLFVIYINFSFISVEADDSASTQILFEFDKLSYNEGDLIYMTIHAEYFTDLYGFQVDLKDTPAYFRIPENQVMTYNVGVGYLFTASDFWLNTKSDGIATAIITRPFEEIIGFDFTTSTNLVDILLIAESDIEDIYDAFSVSDDYDDILFNGANAVVKLSDSNAEAIEYTYVRDEVGPLLSGNTDLTFIEDIVVYDLLDGLEYSDPHHFNDEEIVVELLVHDFDITTPGEYQVEIQLTNKYWTTSSHFRTVFVGDITIPTYTMNGDNPYYVDYGSEYVDPGLTCIDNSNLSCVVEIAGVVNMNSLGSYTITYNVSDQTGNEAAPVQRTIIVEDLSAPVFDIIEDQTIERGISDIDWTTYMNNVDDNYDSVVTLIEVSDNVNYETVGVYEVTVKAIDSFDNELVQVFSVAVEDTIAPIVEGVEDNMSYPSNTDLVITFNEGTALLNDIEIESGTTVSESDEYVLIVTDEFGNRTVVSFEINASYLVYILSGVGLVAVIVPVIIFRRKIFRA